MTAFSYSQILVMAVGLVSPLLSHLILTKGVPDPARKVLSYALGAIGAVIIQVAYHAGESWRAYLGAIFVAWAGMVIGHFTGIPDAVKAKTPNLGIGPKLPQPLTKFAGVEVTESQGPPPPPKSPGKATQARQSKLRMPRQ